MTGRFLVTLAVLGGLAFAPAEAEAGPHVSISVPAVRVDLPRVSVEVRGQRPGPDYVWVEGYTTYDRYGRAVHVPGRWEYVPPPVVVYERPQVVYVDSGPRYRHRSHPGYRHGHGHGHKRGHGHHKHRR